jgi:GT2 family glycosyltransferase
MNGSRPECSVVIHGFNRKALLDRALSTLLDGTRPIPAGMEIIVADSGSTDGSRELVRNRYPQVRLVELTEDRGLAAGRNAGMRVAHGDYIFMLDEDVAVSPRQVDYLVDLMKAHPEAGIVTCCKVDERGDALYQHHVPAPSSMNLLFFLMHEWSIQEGLRAVKRLLNVGETRPHERKQAVEIPFIGGAVLLVRAEAVRQVGPWDENIFFYGEDFDWCYRFRRLGWKILYFPQIKLQAFRGTNSMRMRRASLMAMRSRRYLFLKYLGKRLLPFYYVMALLGLIPRTGYYAVQHLRGRDTGDIPMGRWLWQSLRTIAGAPPPLALKG